MKRGIEILLLEGIGKEKLARLGNGLNIMIREKNMPRITSGLDS